jgi:hypothetical protein
MAPLLEHHAASGHHLQSFVSPTGRLNLGFITEGKLAAIFIKTLSWGFPTGWSFYFINSAPSNHSDASAGGAGGGGNGSDEA